MHLYTVCVHIYFRFNFWKSCHLTFKRIKNSQRLSCQNKTSHVLVSSLLKPVTSRGTISHSSFGLLRYGLTVAWTGQELTPGAARKAQWVRAWRPTFPLYHLHVNSWMWHTHGEPMTPTLWVTETGRSRDLMVSPARIGEPLGQWKTPVSRK